MYAFLSNDYVIGILYLTFVFSLSFINDWLTKISGKDVSSIYNR